MFIYESVHERMCTAMAYSVGNSQGRALNKTWLGTSQVPIMLDLLGNYKMFSKHYKRFMKQFTTMAKAFK